MSFKISDCNVIGFDLDMTLCRYRYYPMVRLLYGSLADFLVREKRYPEYMMDEFTSDEILMVSRHQIVDFNDLSVKWISSAGTLRALARSDKSKKMDRFEQNGKTWSLSEKYLSSGICGEGLMSMDTIYDVCVSVLVLRYRSLKLNNQLEPNNIVTDIAQAYDYIYNPITFQTGEGMFYGTLKKQPEKFIKQMSPDTINWLKELVRRGNKLFLMTSSNTDYAKFVLSKILIDSDGSPIDYWSLFDICIGDAQKPTFFLKENDFYSNKDDYPYQPVQSLTPKTWFSQGNSTVLHNYFKTKLGTDVTFGYFGDSLKCDVISASKAGWKTVYLVEELMPNDTEDTQLLRSETFWKSDIFKNSIQWKMAYDYASLICPSLESISTLSPSHEFPEKLFCPSNEIGNKKADIILQKSFQKTAHLTKVLA